MATIRQWLKDVGFEFDNSIIIFQDVTEEAYCPGWAADYELKDTVVIPSNHPVLDLEFDDGYGSSRCPRFLAKDSKSIYFPTQYDGSTSITVIQHNLDFFIGNNKPLPYPGG